MKYQCAYAYKARCPFALEMRHSSGSDSVVVWQTEAHCFHDPLSAADRSQLSMDPALQGRAVELMRMGVKPFQVCRELNGVNRSASLADASNARYSITLAQLYALQKKQRRLAGYGITSDPKAVAVQMEAYGKVGCVAFWQPYQQHGDGQEQPLIIVLQTPWQQRMLNEFGRRLVFLDATGGTNKYGYMAYALVVSWALREWHAGGWAGTCRLLSWHLVAGRQGLARCFGPGWQDAELAAGGWQAAPGRGMATAHAEGTY